MQKDKFDLFFPVCNNSVDMQSVIRFAENERVANVYIWCADNMGFEGAPENVIPVVVDSLSGSMPFVKMAQLAVAPFVVCILKEMPELPDAEAAARMCDAMHDNASMLYSDYYKITADGRKEAATIDYQAGSLRNDFDFGAVVAIRTEILRESYLNAGLASCRYAGFYQMRLALSRGGVLQHLPEFLYSEQEYDMRKSGEKQFDYVNPAQREVQIEMEKVCTDHLKRIGGYLPPYKYFDVNLDEGEFPVEASVVIPVLNRVSTIADAIRSVLEQETDFSFNVLVVDNHSNDGTGDVIDSFDDSRVCHIIPDSNNLGIGGCWNLAVNSPRCGRFAVQLDSDDLYSSSHTLQKIVDEFYRQRCAMLIGSYKICDFELKTLPPGVIDHKEWTEENGRNNALRINGLGAPRAFYTPVVRRLGFPNVSYGEDYAVGLAISRNYRIGRIYDVLYLCRRWDGNSDAALSHAKVNAHNTYKDSLRTEELNSRIAMLSEVYTPTSVELETFFKTQLADWQQVAERFNDVESVKTRSLECGITLQYNPRRMVSTAAKVNKEDVLKRACFLCKANRPEEQHTVDMLYNMELLVNPYPILPCHLTLPVNYHTPQLIAPMYRDMLALAEAWRGMAVFYNGAKCGASAPDHAHLQAVRCADIPLLGGCWKDELFDDMQPVLVDAEGIIYLTSSYIVPLFVIETVSKEASVDIFTHLLAAMPVVDDEEEPRMNVLSFYRQSVGWITIVFPRSLHRPVCYNAAEDVKRLVSPGLLDMAGLMVTPRQIDFETITSDEAASILREVALSDEAVNKIVENLCNEKC